MTTLHTLFDDFGQSPGLTTFDVTGSTTRRLPTSCPRAYAG
jgi:hypothetical protein